jgi:hypothetical protein
MSNQTDLEAPYEKSSQNTFPDPTAADLDWKGGLKTTGTIRHIAPISLWESEKPFCLTLPLPLEQPKSNLVADSHDIQICDARGKESVFSLDIHGFSFATLPALEINIEDKTAVETDYLAQMEKWLKKWLRADDVHIFDYTVSEPWHCCTKQLLTEEVEEEKADGTDICVD